MKLREYEFSYLAKPYRVIELLCEAAMAITQAVENIRRIKAFFVRLEVTPERLWNAIRKIPAIVLPGVEHLSMGGHQGERPAQATRRAVSISP